ncbi:MULTISPECIES: hypothetical protein [Neisseria]|nr:MULTISPECIES: hypothetical protein [Neisseria]
MRGKIPEYTLRPVFRRPAHNTGRLKTFTGKRTVWQKPHEM